MTNNTNKHKKKSSFMCMRIGNSILVPIDKSLVESLGINPEQTIFEEDASAEGILLKIKSLHINPNGDADNSGRTC